MKQLIASLTDSISVFALMLWGGLTVGGNDD